MKSRVQLRRIRDESAFVILLNLNEELHIVGLFVRLRTKHVGRLLIHSRYNDLFMLCFVFSKEYQMLIMCVHRFLF